MSFFKKLLFGESKQDGAAAQSGGSGRGKSASPPPPQAQKKAIQSMANLDEQKDNIKLKIQHNELKILQEETKIKDILRECGADEKKRERKKAELARHLKEKKRLQTLNEEQERIMDNLQTMVDRMQSTLGNQDVIAAMKQSNAAMKLVSVSADEVGDVMEEAREMMQDQADAAAALSESFAPNDVDEDELFAELDGFQDEIAEEVLFFTHLSSINVRHNFPQQAKKDAQLPDLPHPQVALPAAGKKQVPQKQAARSKAEQEDEDELERCLHSPAPLLGPHSSFDLLQTCGRNELSLHHLTRPAIIDLQSSHQYFPPSGVRIRDLAPLLPPNFPPRDHKFTISLIAALIIVHLLTPATRVFSWEGSCEWRALSCV